MTHTHYQSGGDRHGNPPCVEIGASVCIREWLYEGEIISFFVAHERDVPFDPAIHASERCEGRVPVRGDRAWTMTGSLADGDLTLLPSISCTNLGGTCGGSHGWVRDGKWVPA